MEKECCGKNTCGEQGKPVSDQNLTNANKAKTTCCGCDVCSCGDNCLCPTGTISCEPCQEFVDSKKKDN